MTARDLTRRLFLGSAVAAAGALTLPTVAAAAGGTWTGSTSANGWPVLARANSFRIEGSTRSVRLADGDAATILLHVARRFNYEISTLRDGDVLGHTTDRHIAQPYESNYLSGTAIAIRPICYPVGASGLLYPAELTVVRDILAELDGTVSWGGDEKVAKESHFQIALPPGSTKIQAMARRIAGWNAGPGGQGAGAVDAFDLNRMRAARQFQRHTR
jgi:hypothetical protein